MPRPTGIRAITDLLTNSATLQLLRRLARDRVQLLLEVAEGTMEPVIILPEGVTDDGFELLAVLPPSLTLQALPPGFSVVLRSAVNGATCELHAKLRAAIIASDGFRLQCAPPHEGRVRERRDTPRFSNPNDGVRTLAVVHVPGEVMLCRLVDISREGLRLRLDTPGVELGATQVVYSEIRRGDHLLQSKIGIRWRAVIKGHLEFGARFLPPDRAFTNRLDRLVAEIERYWMRHRL